MDNRPGIKIFGRPGCALSYTIRDFLGRSDVPFEWIEIDGQMANENDALPVCEFPDGTRIVRPTVRQITEKLGWFHDAKLSEYDLAIYGAGPAGLSAAVYGASEGLKTIVIERFAIGGQAGSTSKIENYLGFPDGISGADLADRARDQAYRFGAEILLGREGVRGEFPPGRGVGFLADGTKIVARASIVATGVAYRQLEVPDEPRFIGVGLYYGAGVSEALLSSSEDVYVIGGGNSAGQAAMNFSRFARSVTVVIRGTTLKKTLSNYLLDRINAAPNVEVLTETEVTALHGDRTLESITLTSRTTGERRDVSTRWLFACIGAQPHTEWAIEAGIVRDEGGYLVTGPDLAVDGKLPANWPLTRPPYQMEASIPGLFAAGDVRHGSVKRCASAVGEGAMAVASVHQYLASV